MKRFLPAMSLIFAGACATPCSSVCDKLLSCSELSQGSACVKECELDCAVQESSYEDDEALDVAFEAYKECVIEKTCAEIAAGACHNSDLYAF